MFDTAANPATDADAHRQIKEVLRLKYPGVLKQAINDSFLNLELKINLNVIGGEIDDTEAIEMPISLLLNDGE